MDDPRMAALDECMDLTAHADAGDEAALEELVRLHRDEQRDQQIANEIRGTQSPGGCNRQGTSSHTR